MRPPMLDYKRKINMLAYIIGMVLIMSPGDGQVECPRNETRWDERAQIVCNDDMTERGLVYHCLPTKHLNTSEEWCLIATKIPKDNCAIYNTFISNVSYDHLNSCSKRNITNCPNTSYYSNEIYKYPSCMEIDPVNMCYIAASTCSKKQRGNPDVSGAESHSSFSTWIALLICTSVLFI